MLESDTGSTVVHKHGRAIIETSFCREKHVHLWAVQGLVGGELRVQSNDLCSCAQAAGRPWCKAFSAPPASWAPGGACGTVGMCGEIPYASLTCHGWF